jgi:hypothetical protein
VTLANQTPLARARGVRIRHRGRHWLRPIGVTGVVAGFLVGAVVLGSAHASSILDDELLEAVRADGALVVRVSMDFVPEPFHMAFFQEVGSLRGVDGTSVCVRVRSEQALRDIARQLWVTSMAGCER